MNNKLLCLVTLFVVPTEVNAQVFTPVPIPSMSMPGLGTYIPTEENGGLPRTAPEASAVNNVVEANYIASKARTRENLAKFVAKTRSVDSSGADQMEHLFASTDIMNQIGQAMDSVGLRPDNVADAYAVWWVAAWKAVNNKDIGDSSVMYNAVKQQVMNVLSATPQFSSASDALKQEMAESMLIQAAMIDAHVDAAAGDPSQQMALAKAVNQGAKQMDMDLTKMDLTKNGFVKRSGKRSDVGDGAAVPSQEGSALAANDNAAATARENDSGKLALYGVGGAALLAGVFALGKSFGGKG